MDGGEKKEQRKSSLPDDLVAIAHKPLENYLLATMIKFESMNNVRLSVNYSHISKAERLITLFRPLGVEETKRDTVENNRVIITISK